MTREMKLAAYGVAGVVLLVTVLFGAFQSCDSVHAGHVAVQTTFGGRLHDDVVTDEGLHFHVPWVSYHSYRTQQQTITVHAETNATNAAVTQDIQTLGYTLNVAWYPETDNLIGLVRHVSRDQDYWVNDIIVPSVIQGAKQAFSEYSLRTIVTQRDAVKHHILEYVRNELHGRLEEKHEGLGSAIRITDVMLVNVDFDDSFEQVIEQTVQAEQRVRQTEQENRQFELEQQRQVLQAEQARRSQVINALGETEAMLIRTQGEMLQAQAYRAVGRDPNFAEFLSSWNGQFPTTLFNLGGDSGAALFQIMSVNYEADAVSSAIQELRDARQELIDELARLQQPPEPQQGQDLPQPHPPQPVTDQPEE